MASLTCVRSGRFLKHLGFRKNKAITSRSVLSMAESCKAGKERRREVKPKQHKNILAGKIQNLFEDNDMIAVLSYFDMNNSDWNNFFYEAKKTNIHFSFLPNKLVHRALDDTPFVNMSPLFISTNVIAYSEQPEVDGLLQALATQKKVSLLGGKIQNRLFAVDGFKWLAKLPTIEQLHGELSCIVSSQTQSLSQTLMKSQCLLTQNLVAITNKDVDI